MIWKTVERAATDTTSVHHVVENADETPDDGETVMDWLRTIEPNVLEDVVNGLLTEHATTILNPEVVCSERSTVVSPSARSNASPTVSVSFGRSDERN